MSSYEDYQRASELYDQTRLPIGIEILRGCLGMSDRPVSEMVVLDAGCGTGNYSQELLRFVGKVEAVDLNPGMLAVATSKLDASRKDGRIRFHEASIDELPLGDASLDAVIISQVLHHLGDQEGGDYPAHRRVFEEMRRVLKPNGRLVINTCSQEQLLNSFWCFALIPEAMERLRAKYVPMDILRELLQNCGFTVHERIVPLDGVLQGPSYFDPTGPLRPEWRAGNSTFALATDAELRRMDRQIRDLEERGALEEYMEEQDQMRRVYGQTTFVHASRDGE